MVAYLLSWLLGLFQLVLVARVVVDWIDVLGSGRGGAVLLSIMLTAAFSGGLWLFIGPALPPAGGGLWAGIAVFALAGILATVLGRLFYFRSIELTSAIEVGLTRAGDHVMLTVRDDGVGISDTALAGGEGLGLRTMRYRADRVGGEFEVRHREGGGTVVAVTFEPAQAEEEE